MHFSLDIHREIWYNVSKETGHLRKMPRKATKSKRKPMKNTAGRRRAQRKYNSKPEQIKRRSQRNQARRKMEKSGRVRKGDGKDVNHRDHNTGNNSDSNLQVLPKRVNRRDGGPRKR